MKGNFYAYAILIGLIGLIIFYYLFVNGAEKLYIMKCNIETDLEFEGIVRNYSTNIKDETSTITLEGSKIIYAIPRSSKELDLNEGDTVKKIKGQHVYLVKHFLMNRRNRPDTFLFDCSKIK